MTLMERKYKKNLRDDAKFRRIAREIVTEVGCFIGLIAWTCYLAYLFVGAVAEKWR